MPQREPWQTLLLFRLVLLSSFRWMMLQCKFDFFEICFLIIKFQRSEFCHNNQFFLSNFYKYTLQKNFFHNYLFIAEQILQMIEESDLNNFDNSIQAIQSPSHQTNNSKSLKDIKITCIQGNEGFIYCIDCQNYPVICRTNQCKCETIHQKCLSSKSLKKINQNLISYSFNAFNTDQLKQQLDKIFDKMIDQISQLRQKIFYNLKYFGLNKQLIDTLQKIENYSNFKLKGIDIKKAFQISLNEKQQFKLQTLQIYQKDINLSLKNTLHLFKKINEAFDSQCVKYPGNVTYNLRKSKIIKNQEQRKQIRELFLQFDQIQSIEKIYAATQDGFCYDEQIDDDVYKPGFKKCLNKENLLYLVKNQHNKRYGAFSPCVLTAQNKTKFIEDPSLKTFIFSLDMNCKSKIIQKQYAVRHGFKYQQDGSLVNFGKAQSCSLIIGQNSEKQHQKNWINGFGDSFQKNKFTNQQLYGSRKNNHKLKQIEVFQIKFKKS